MSDNSRSIAYAKIIQYLTHFGPTLDMEWLIHYPKRQFWNSFSGKNSVIF